VNKLVKPGPLKENFWDAQGRIIHEAGELGPGLPGTMKIYKVGPLWAPKFPDGKFAVF